MVTLLHTADTHLGYRQYHRPEREADFREAFYEVIEQAISRDVDAVVHAGDLFNSSRPGIDALSDALEGLKRLAAAEIPFLAIVGNHDGTRDRQWLDVFASLGLATRLGEDGVDIESEREGESTRVALYGLDHVEPGRRDRLEYDFEPEAARAADAAVLVAHGLFEPFPNGDWDARAICRQSSVEFDAILAGDDHTNQETILSEGEALLSYPGSTERTAADQREPRRFDLIDVSSAGELTRRSVELETREFVYVDVEMSEGEGVDRVLDALGELEDGTELADTALIVTLTGGGERVSSGPIEERGLGRDALTVRVNDRREFEEEVGRYGEVAFADPDRAVEQRRESMDLSENGREIEQLVRETDAVPDSNVAETVEARVREWLEDRPAATFERTEPDATAETRADTPGEGGRKPTSGEPGEETTATEASEGESDLEAASEPTPDAGGTGRRETASGTESEPSNDPTAAEATAAEPAAVESAARNEDDGDEPDRSENDEEEKTSERTTQSTLWD
jgi:DNA repair exonuclease SbcCD nuclease subunit